VYLRRRTQMLSFEFRLLVLLEKRNR
jgi:hypothetical protein